MKLVKKGIAPGHYEYTGKIIELRGKKALVRARSLDDFPHITFNTPIVMAQFDDEIVYNDKRMDVGWHPFAPTDFTPIGQKPIF